jgi:hypothetical protein
MVFALDKDNGELLALESPLDAPARCKPIDVKDGYWLFFAEDGSPLEAWFEDPTVADESPETLGEFALERAVSGRWLQERLDEVTAVKGCGLATVEAVAETLKANRAKRVIADRRRA